MIKSFLGYGWVIDKSDVPEDDHILYMDCNNDKLFCGFILEECDSNNSAKFLPSSVLRETESRQLQMLGLYKEISGKVADCRPNLVLISKEV